MFNQDILIAIGMAAMFFILAILQNNKKIKLDYMAELKLAFLIAGISFKDIKMQKIAGILMSIVTGLEQVNLSGQEKKRIAMQRAVKEIYQRIGVTLEDDVLSTIIDIAVSYMQNEK